MRLAFPFAVFIIYGTHWGSLAYNQDPIHQITSAFAEEGGATGAPYNSSQCFHNITMSVTTLRYIFRAHTDERVGAWSVSSL